MKLFRQILTFGLGFWRLFDNYGCDDHNVGSKHISKGQGYLAIVYNTPNVVTDMEANDTSNVLIPVKCVPFVLSFSGSCLI